MVSRLRDITIPRCRSQVRRTSSPFIARAASLPQSDVNWTLRCAARVGQGTKKRDDRAALGIGQMQRIGRQRLCGYATSLTQPAVVIVKRYHVVKRAEDAVVHVWLCKGDVAQRRCTKGKSMQRIPGDTFAPYVRVDMATARIRYTYHLVIHFDVAQRHRAAERWSKVACPAATFAYE